MCKLMDKTLSESWWGRITFSLNECKAWQVGERMVVVQRHECEWRIWNIESKDENTHPLELVTPSNTDFLSSPPTQRFLVKHTESSITVMPRLADRAMVIRPSSVISVLPDQSSHLYVSTQLWIAFSLTQNSEPMFDVPCVVLGAAGILAVAIGFASQTSASNLISGLFLMMERPFSVGDNIKVGDTVGEVI